MDDENTQAAAADDSTEPVPTAPTVRSAIESRIAAIEGAIEHAKAQAEAEINDLRAKLSVNAHPLLAQLIEHPIDEIRELFNQLRPHLT